MIGEARALHGPPRADVYLHAGEVVVAAEPLTVLTILGSCVAVCLWQPDLAVGGINHFMLPNRGNDQRSTRYGEFAIQVLIERLYGLGARCNALQAKVFGGARVTGQPSAGRHDLGRANVKLALWYLSDRQIPVVAHELYGNQGRKLLFRLSDGAAWVKDIQRLPRVERTPDGHQRF